MSPTVSVILPTYNRAGLLQQAVDSVLRQSYRDLELIVVDDASEDDTRQVIERLADPRVHYIRHELNLGGSAARNTGIAAARGRFIAFQDSDDVWRPDKLRKQVALADDAEPGADVVYCGYTKTMNGEDVYVPDPALTLREGDILGQVLVANFVGTPTLLVRRSVLDKVGGFDERLGRFQDWDLAIRLAGVTRFRLVDEPLVIAGDTPGNITSDAAAGRAAMRILLETHRGAYRRHPSARARVLTNLGHLACLAGAAAEARRCFRQALGAKPYALRVWGLLLLSLFGGWGYRLAHAAKGRLVSERPGISTR